MAITVFNSAGTGSPTPYRAVANPLVTVGPATTGASVPTTGQIWPRGSKA